MRKQELLERLCALVSLVAEKEFKNDVAHDCFCGKGPLGWDATCSVDEHIIVFIEEAVKVML